MWFDALHLSGYHIIKDHVSCSNGNFHHRNFRDCSLITLAWLGYVNWRSGTNSFWFAFPTKSGFACQVITWIHQVTCRNGSVSFWYVFPPRLVFFFYLGFFSRTFTIHRTTAEGGGYLFNSSLPLPPISQTFKASFQHVNFSASVQLSAFKHAYNQLDCFEKVSSCWKNCPQKSWTPGDFFCLPRAFLYKSLTFDQSNWRNW